MIAIKITEYQAYACNINVHKFFVTSDVGLKHIAKGNRKSTMGGLLYTETMKYSDGRLKVCVWPSHKRKAKKTLVDEFFIDEPTGDEVLKTMLERAYVAKDGEKE